MAFKTIVICDRCKDEQERKELEGPVAIYKGHYYDLCDVCILSSAH